MGHTQDHPDAMISAVTPAGATTSAGRPGDDSRGPFGPRLWQILGNSPLAGTVVRSTGSKVPAPGPSEPWQ